MPAPNISVIVPVSNALLHLQRCLDSLVTQTCSSFEIVVVDDASDDGSGVWLDQYASVHEGVLVIHHACPLGVSAARNTGIAAAKGMYFAFADADDWAEPTMLETLHRAITSTNSQVAHIEHRLCSAEETFRQPFEERMYVMSGVEAAEKMLEREEYAVWSRLYESDLVRSLGDEPFPVGLTCEDRVFNMRVLPKARFVVASNRIEYHYFMTMGSISYGGLSRRAMDIFKADELMVADARTFGGARLIDLALDRQAKGAFSMLVKYARFGITDVALSGKAGQEILVALRRRFISDYPRLIASNLPISKRIVAWQLRYIPMLVRAEFSFYNRISGVRGN